MAVVLISAAEVLEHCAELEQDGIEFYEGIQRGARSKWLRDLAAALVKAEQVHKEHFLSHARESAYNGSEDEAETGKARPAELERLMRERVFVPGETAEKVAPTLDDLTVINMAIRNEESVALLLAELRLFVPVEDRHLLDVIIEEEWGHRDRLLKLKRKHFR